MTDHVPAAAEGLSANRRTALAMTGSGLVAALAAMTGAATASSTVDASLAAVEALIQRHTEARRASRAAWDAVPGDYDPRRPEVRVQVGRVLRGRDDDGNDIREPIYAYTPEQIDKEHARHLNTSLIFAGNPEQKAATIERWAKWAADKKATLAALQAEDDRILDEIGFTAAEMRAEAAFEAECAIEEEILAFVPATLAAAVRLAAWAAAGRDEGYLDNNDMRTLVQSIAAAGAVS